jgi:hypothetical protein
MRLHAANRVLFSLVICLGCSAAISSFDQNSYSQKQQSAGDQNRTAKSAMKEKSKTKLATFGGGCA